MGKESRGGFWEEIKWKVGLTCYFDVIGDRTMERLVAEWRKVTM